jgi:hypothetical protein
MNFAKFNLFFVKILENDNCIISLQKVLRKKSDEISIT